VPSGFPFEAYEKQIEHIFRTHRRHYQQDEDASELRQEYYAAMDNLTVEIITTIPAKKAARGKGGAAARPKKVFDESMLYQILEDQSHEKVVTAVLKFVRSLEEKVDTISVFECFERCTCIAFVTWCFNFYALLPADHDYC
jgi:hypothetical protein